MPRPMQELIVDVSLAPTSIVNGASSRPTAQSLPLPPKPLPAKPLPAKLKRKGEALSTVTIPPSDVSFVHREQGDPSLDSARPLPDLPPTKDTLRYDDNLQQKLPNRAPLTNDDPIVKRERSPSLGLGSSSFANTHEHSDDDNGRTTGLKLQDPTEEMQLAWPSPSPSPRDHNPISSHQDTSSRLSQIHPTQHYYTPQHSINQYYPSHIQDLPPPPHATNAPYQAENTKASTLERRDMNQSRAPEPELDGTREMYATPSAPRSTRQDPTPPFSRKRPRSDDRHWEPSDTPSSFRRKVSEAGDRSYQPPPHANRDLTPPPPFPRITDYRDSGPRGYDSYRPSSPEQSNYVDTVQHQRGTSRSANGRPNSVRPIARSDPNDTPEAGASRRGPEIPLERRIQDPPQARQPASMVASTSRQDVSTNRRGRPKMSPDRRTRPNRRNGPRLSDRAFSPDNTSQSLASRINTKSLENRIA
ncbi:hypothetical protein NLI96_g9036 [Meripilus lineatus]|uniref:Uncharacterized protein n=1 Tax=Meripilus lineatus TaxID=2056292 RepID=A0AAD5V1G4_9APHY|nr:hypothetical protein NLI96_g9036 [Physisporinus lineatus]